MFTTRAVKKRVGGVVMSSTWKVFAKGHIRLMMDHQKISCETVILKSVETRFVSRHSMTERVMHHKKVYKQFVKDEHFLECLHNQPKVIRVEVHTLVCRT